MSDDSVDFGPLVRSPAETAADLASLIAAIVTVSHPTPSAAVVEANLGPDAPFCYFCGVTVPEGTVVCPSCHERLD
jgi:hypothetical protein